MFSLLLQASVTVTVPSASSSSSSADKQNDENTNQIHNNNKNKNNKNVNVYLRIPGWATEATIDGKAVGAGHNGTMYLAGAVVRVAAPPPHY